MIEVNAVRTKPYYVYALAYPDGTIFYVGKGMGDRIGDHEREAKNSSSVCHCEKCKIIREIWASGNQVQKHKLYTCTKECDAFAFEKECITAFSVKSPLVNQFLNPLRQADTSVPQADDGEDYLSRAETREILGIADRTLSRYIMTDRIKKYRRGIRSVVFKRSDVEWLKEYLQGVRPEEQDESK